MSKKNHTNVIGLPIAALFLASLLVSACGQSVPGKSNASKPLPVDSNNRVPNDHAKFSWINANILQKRCMDCHSANQGDGDGLASANFDSYDGVLKVISPSHPETSSLYIAVASKKMPKGMDPMPGMPNPPPPTPLSADELQAISDWISAGAVND